MTSIYCISGLGATRRLFDYLEVPGHEVHPLDWIEPAERESIKSYAARMAKGIPGNSPCILLGVSFGGVVALEVADIVHPELVILVSSVRDRSQLPWYLRLIGRLRLHRLIPAAVIKFSGPLVRYFNGATTPRSSDSIRRDLADISFAHVAWAIDQILRWPGKSIGQDTLHIHGSADRILPVRYVRPDAVVPGGPHIMIVTRAEEVGRIISEHLRTRC